jgi:hypothetical protein
VRVSPLQLGAMSIGDQWQNYGMGSMDKENSFKLLDAYFDAGVSSPSPLFSLLCRTAFLILPQGNFIDTANN